MYGLDKDTDFSFLSEKQLEQVCFGWVSMRLNFDGHTTLVLECTLKHGTKDGQVSPGDTSEPISCSSLLTLLASSVKRADIIGEGDIELFFSSGDKVRIYDSNDSTESYHFTFPGGMIIV